VVQQSGALLETVLLRNHRLGESDSMGVLAADTFLEYLSAEELSRVEKTIAYDEIYVSIEEEAESHFLKLKAPIKQGAVLGRVGYRLDGADLFSGDVLAARDAESRTFRTDFAYRADKVRAAVFSVQALPFWISGFMLVVLVLMIAVRSNRRKKRSYYRLRNRY